MFFVTAILEEAIIAYMPELYKLGTVLLFEVYNIFVEKYF